jgi:hypothetical protein
MRNLMLHFRFSFRCLAAGYASGEEVGNMSAILTGMGGMGPAMSKSSTATVGGP